MERAKEAVQEQQKAMKTEIQRLHDMNSDLTKNMQEAQEKQNAREEEWADMIHAAQATQRVMGTELEQALAQNSSDQHTWASERQAFHAEVLRLKMAVEENSESGKENLLFQQQAAQQKHEVLNIVDAAENDVSKYKTELEKLAMKIAYYQTELYNCQKAKAAEEEWGRVREQEWVSKMETEREVHKRERTMDGEREKKIEADYKRLVDSRKTSNLANSQSSSLTEKLLKEQDFHKLQIENQKLTLSHSDDQKRIQELILKTEELVKSNK